MKPPIPQDPTSLASAESTETVYQVHLIDATGNDEQLSKVLETMSQQLNSAAPGTSKYRILDLLGALKNGCGWVGWSAHKLWGTIYHAVMTWTNAEATLIKAKAEAKKLTAEAEATIINAKAEAKVKEAEAKQKEAEARIKNAEAKIKLQEVKAMQLTQQQRQEILKKLGNDWQAELIDGHLQIVVTKQIAQSSENPLD